MDKYLFFMLLVCGMLFYSCDEGNNREPAFSDTVIPGQVSNVRVEPLPGAVKLTYDLPDDQNLSYVKAECLINGVVRQAKASSYTNTLTVEGFADVSQYTIYLYSVNRSGKASEPITVQAQPLTPNYLEVFNNIKLVEDWGGVAVIFENPNEADLAISLIYIDETGLWTQEQSFYTKSQQGQFALRGLEAKETRFGVFLRDRWNNSSDTLVKDLTPRFERQLDHTGFMLVPMPGTATWNRSDGLLFPEAAWDGNMSKLNDLNPLHITAPDGQWPHWFTLDLGVEKVRLSRFKLWQRGAQFAYNDRSPRTFEIWGSMNPNSDGSWDPSWVLLLEGEIIKPSGLPLGQLSDEDTQARLDGHEFSFPLDIPDVKYIRFVCTETWGKQLSYFMMQIAFWGQDE